MRIVCAPVKKWPKNRSVDLYEFDYGDEKRIYDRDEKLCYTSIDVGSEPRCDGPIMVSYHNFQETPDLEAVLAKMRERHPEAAKYKIAVFARSTLDALKMLHFQRRHPDVIGLSMGEKGVVTRIMSSFTYAPLTEEDKTAPGQLLWSELDTIYHYKRISNETKIYALIGNPVSQSIGHLYHNDRFRMLGMDAVYVKMALMPEEIEKFFKEIEGLPFYGFSVTAPLKEKFRAYPINTMYRTSAGWEYSNTDGVAVAEVLGDVKGKHIVILGTGGAAKGIAMALQEAKVTLLRRHMEIPPYDVLINATSSQSPDFNDHFIPGKIVMDIGIKTSPFLCRAQACGSICLGGFPMYLAQALLQSQVWQQYHNLSLDEACQSVGLK